MISVLAITFVLVGATFVLAATFLFGQNIPSSTVSASVKGCTDVIGAIDTLVIDATRGGSGVTFVCPPGSFGANHYAIQPLSAGTSHWNHSAGIGGFNALYLILSYAVPTQGCHAGTTDTGVPIDPAWFVNITATTGTITFFDSQHAFAYCGEYTHFGNYGSIYVSWTQ
jgi:hypothetical protein